MRMGKELALRMVAARYDEMDGVVLAGSRSRGDWRENSDFDLVLLSAELPKGAWRGMEQFEGAEFECFSHDPATLRYFLEEMERPSGEPALAAMLAEGVVLVDRGGLVPQAQTAARTLLAAGPPRWNEETIAARRYAITDLAGALRQSGEEVVLGAELLGRLGEFCLRAAGKWSASGKMLSKALAAWDAGFTADFHRAFAGLFAGESDDAVQRIVDRALAPYGGRLRSGYRQQAPAEWRL